MGVGTGSGRGGVPSPSYGISLARWIDAELSEVPTRMVRAGEGTADTEGVLLREGGGGSLPPRR